MLLHVQILICSCTFILHVQFNKEYSMCLSSLGVVASNHWIHRPMDDILSWESVPTIASYCRDMGSKVLLHDGNS